MKWSKVSKPKSVGDRWVGNLQEMNWALLSKWCPIFGGKREALWEEGSSEQVWGTLRGVGDLVP